MVALQDIKPRTHKNISGKKKKYYCFLNYGIHLKSYFKSKLVNIHFLTAQATTTSGTSLQMADTLSPLARGFIDFFSLKEL